MKNIRIYMRVIQLFDTVWNIGRFNFLLSITSVSLYGLIYNYYLSLVLVYIWFNSYFRLAEREYTHMERNHIPIFPIMDQSVLCMLAVLQENGSV